MRRWPSTDTGRVLRSGSIVKYPSYPLKNRTVKGLKFDKDHIAICQNSFLMQRNTPYSGAAPAVRPQNTNFHLKVVKLMQFEKIKRRNPTDYSVWHDRRHLEIIFLVRIEKILMLETGTRDPVSPQRHPEIIEMYIDGTSLEDERFLVLLLDRYEELLSGLVYVKGYSLEKEELTNFNFLNRFYGLYPSRCTAIEEFQKADRVRKRHHHYCETSGDWSTYSKAERIPYYAKNFYVKPQY